MHAGNTGVRSPIRLAVSNGLVFIVDSDNDRVITLDASSLFFIRQVITEVTVSEFLLRIALTDGGGRMFLAHNNFHNGRCTRGHAKAYGLTWM
jgi:hypothetical protein